MSTSDEYNAIYRRIGALVDIDKPTLLREVNSLELSDYEQRRELLLKIGYKPAKYHIWFNLYVLSQCEWTNLLLGTEPMDPSIRFPNPDDFGVLIRSVKAWLVMHRLVADNLRKATPTNRRPLIEKKDLEAFPNDSYNKSDLIKATSSAGLHIPVELRPEAEVALSPTWVFRPAATRKWEVGVEDDTKLLPPRKGFEDLSKALRHPNEDVLRMIIGEDPNAYLPSFGADAQIDSRYKAEIQKDIAEIKESLSIARDEGNSSLVEEYEAELEQLEVHLKRGTKPGFAAKRLDAGHPVKVMTNTIRNRKRTIVKNLREAELDGMADHIEKQYDVGDWSVTYLEGGVMPSWILNP